MPKANVKRQGIRLLGVGVSQFNAQQTSVSEQLDMFQQQNNKESNIDKLTDDINQRFGSEALIRGTTVKNKP